MPKITYISHDGKETVVDAKAGASIMETALDNGIDGIVGECGGCCSCATCHCYVEPEWFELTGPADEMEVDLLDFAIEPRENSRLGCQIAITEALDGLVVRMPPSQF